MNEYLFFTTEGQTVSPNGSDVENCQLLGRVSAPDAAQAKVRLLEDNPWILEDGFSLAECLREQILPDAQRQDVLRVLDHFWEGAKRDFETVNPDRKQSHVFLAMQRLRQMCETATSHV